MVEHLFTVQVAVVVDIMEVVQVCLALEVVTAEVEAVRPMQIKQLHQPLPIQEETTLPMGIVQLLGQVQVVGLHCFRLQ